MLAAGVAVLAGDLAGLAAARHGLPPSLPLAAAVLAGLLHAWLRPAILRRPPAPLLLALCAASGAAVGLAAGRTAGAACTRSLATGDRISAVGRAAHDVGVPAEGRTARLELRDVQVAAGGRSCRVPGLLARIRPAGEPPRAGEPVGVEGVWWSWGRGGWPAPAGRAGFLRGRTVRRVVSGPAAEGGPGLRLRLRAAASRRLASRLPPDVAPAAAALTLADRSGLDPRVSRRFADAGLAHLLAISGLHVGLVGGGLLWLLGRVTGRRGLRYGTAGGLVGGYVALIGAPASALRAAVLFGGWCAVRTRGAPARTSEVLGAAAAAGAMAQPLAPAAPGYQLSFAGFTGVVLGAALAGRAVEAVRRRRGSVGRRLRRVLVAVAASAGAFLTTAPFAAAHFGRAAPAAVLSNFAGVPLTTASLAGLAGTLALPGAVAGWAANAATVSLRLLFRTADRFAALPLGHAEVAPPGPIAWIAAGLALAAALLLAAGARPARAAVPLAAALAVGLAGPAALAAVSGDEALVCQLDVGQGDAAVVRTHRGHWIVLDGGPRGWQGDAGLERLVPFLRDRGARSVSLVVLSHPHLDHLGGLPALLRARPVARWLDAGNPAASAPYAGALDAAEEAGVAWLPARSGDRLRVDGVEVLVLAPSARTDGRPLWSGPPQDANEASVAVRIRIPPGFVYLNTGDAGMAQEEGILYRWPADTLRAQLLKVGHHGSRTSTSRRWLEAVQPVVAVISAGAGNRYGHPHRAALERLQGRAGRVWRTDRDGTFCAEVRRDGRWRIVGEDGWRSVRRGERGVSSAGGDSLTRG